MQGQARPFSLAPKAFRLVQVRNAQVTHRLIDMRIRSWCTDRFTSCAEPCASTASARFCYPACGPPGSGWPLHRLRTACAQSHFGVLFINGTKSLFFITKKSIISAKSPGFIIFWMTLECSPVIKTDSGLCFITFTLWKRYKTEWFLSIFSQTLKWPARPGLIKKHASNK